MILIHNIYNKLKKCSIQSGEFLNYIYEYIKPFDLAKHFVHELFIYCISSCKSIKDYDAKCVYFLKKDENESLSENFKLQLPILLDEFKLIIEPNIELDLTND